MYLLRRWPLFLRFLDQGSQAMRVRVHDTPIQFRANERLLAAARARAERDGMSLSELIRAALRKAAGYEETGLSGIRANAALGSKTADIVTKAARGDIVSQHWLLEDRLAALSKYESNSVAACAIAMEAVLFGRLLASHGHAQDVQRLAGALCHAASTLRANGRHDLGDFFMAESISLLEQLAEDGNDLAAMCSQALIGGEAPELSDAVRAMRAKSDQTEEHA
jgi:hypothetical protein